LFRDLERKLNENDLYVIGEGAIETNKEESDGIDLKERVLWSG